MSDDKRTREEILEKRKGFLLYFNKCALAREKLDDTQAGSLFKGVSLYAETGELFETADDKVDMLFGVFKIDIDNGTEQYIRTSEQNSKNARSGWEKRKSDNATASDRIRPHTMEADKDIDRDKDNDKDIDNSAASDSADARRGDVSSLFNALTHGYPLEAIPGRTIAYEILVYYLDTYFEMRGEEHPPIPFEVYRDKIFPSIAAIRNNKGDCLHNAEKHDEEETLELYRQIIDKHFGTDYGDKCDYNMVHFFSGEIRANRYREVKGV